MRGQQRLTEALQRQPPQCRHGLDQRQEVLVRQRPFRAADRGRVADETDAAPEVARATDLDLEMLRKLRRFGGHRRALPHAGAVDASRVCSVTPGLERRPRWVARPIMPVAIVTAGNSGIGRGCARRPRVRRRAHLHEDEANLAEVVTEELEAHVPLEGLRRLHRRQARSRRTDQGDGARARRARRHRQRGRAGQIATKMTGNEDVDPRDRAQGHPAGRPGDANEIAAVVALLCSPGASYVTGASYLVDGGMLLMTAMANQLAQ